MRRSTRVPLHTAVTIASLDGTLAFREVCETLIVNLHGCAVQSPRPLKIGAGVQLEVDRYRVLGRVVDLASIGTTSWMLGIALDRPGNIWGIANPPEDWAYALPQSMPDAEAAVLAQPTDAPGVQMPDSSVPEAGKEEIRAQIAQLEKLQLEELASLREERAKSQAVREATEKAAAEQLERLRQARAYIESLACSLPASIESQAQQQAKVLLQQLRQDLAQEVSLRISTTMDGLEGRLKSILLQNSQQLRDDMAKELEARQKMAGLASVSELRALQSGMRDAARQFTADFNGQSERAQAELRQVIEDLVLEQHKKFDQRETAAMAALQTVGANLLAGMRQQLVAELAQQEQASQQQTAREAVIPGETLERISGQLLDQLRTQLQQDFAERERALQTAQGAAASQLHQVAEQLRTQIQESLAERERAMQTAQSAAASQLQQAAEQLRAQIQESFAERERAQQALQNSASSQLQQLAEQLRAELQGSFAEHERVFQSAEGAATAHLERLQKQIEELTGVVDVELQSHAEETVREAVSEAQEHLRQACAELREAQLGQARAELDRQIPAMLEQAGEGARRTLESLQQQISKDKNAAAELHGQLDQIQGTLARDIEHFQEMVRNTLVEAGGEIRGRIQQAVAGAAEPLEARRAELQQQMAALAQQHTEDLRRHAAEVDQQLENTRQAVSAGCEQTRAAAESQLQSRLSELLKAFAVDLQRLSQESITGWQKAMGESLAALPVLLAQKLPRQL